MRYLIEDKIQRCNDSSSIELISCWPDFPNLVNKSCGGLTGTKFWIIDLSSLTPIVPYSYFRYFNRSELEKAASYFSYVDKFRFFVSRIALKQALALELDCDPQTIVIKNNRHGMLDFSGPNDKKGFYISLSHTTTAVAISISTDSQVGIDVEANVEWVALEHLRDVFTKSEQNEISALPEWKSKERILRDWTLKEAFFKSGSLIGDVDFSQVSVNFIKENCEIFQKTIYLTSGCFFLSLVRKSGGINARFNRGAISLVS